MYSPSACVWNAIDKQYDTLAVSVVNTGCALPARWPYETEGKGSQAETLSLALRKNSGAITLLQEGSLLILAVLSSYGSLKSLVSSLCAFIQSYDVIDRMFL